MLDRTQRGRDRTCLFRDDERPTTFGERGPRQRHSPLIPSAVSGGVRVSRRNSSPSPRLPTLRLAVAVGTVPIALGLRRRQPHILARRGVKWSHVQILSTRQTLVQATGYFPGFV